MAGAECRRANAVAAWGEYSRRISYSEKDGYRNPGSFSATRLNSVKSIVPSPLPPPARSASHPRARGIRAVDDAHTRVSLAHTLVTRIGLRV